MNDTLDRKTLDEIVASNVAELRKARGLSVAKLAVRLGVARTTVYDMEGRADRRRQREFRWSELVALCAVLDTNLYQLVLPGKGVEISDKRPFLVTDGDSPDIAVYHPNVKIGRDGLGWRLFGIGGDKINPEHPAETFAEEHNRRITRLEQVLGLGAKTRFDQRRHVDEPLPLTTEIDLFDADGRHVKTVILPHVGEPDNEEE